jgi:uncharacterized protein
MIMNVLAEKQERLEQRLRELDRVMVAYSGGIDSAYLAWCAHRVLGANMLAIIADSASLARHHFQDAVLFAQEHQILLEILRTEELDNVDYVKNDALRCFHCKNELFVKMEEAKSRLGFTHLAYGMNLDDRGDFRPGQSAARQHGVLAPLVEAGLTKADIRTLARDAGLRVWDKPASACLSSRVAYGQPVTREVLSRVEKGEDYLRGLGLRQFRVRDHAGMARIEIAEDEMGKVFSSVTMKELSSTFKALGFQFVTLDCEGYRSGSMNGALPAEILAHANRLS